MKKYAFLLFLSILWEKETLAQDTLRVRNNLKILCSQEFAGRGYLQEGHLKAAEWIKNQFQQLGLLPIEGNYFHPFSLDQNLFPSTVSCNWNNRPLKLGKDFLPDPGCPPLKKKFTIRILDSINIQQITSNKKLNYPKEAWVFTSRTPLPKDFKKNYHPGLWIQTSQKLTHSLDQEQNEDPAIVVKDSFPLGPNQEISVDIQSVIKKNIAAKNVVALVRGTEKPDSFLVITAHYDHLGMLGKETWFPGANDNASGTSMMLEMADWYAKHPPRYSILFIAFSGEEAGLIGSFSFVHQPLIPLKRIRFLLNLDLLGFGENGATVVNATLHPSEFNRLQQLNHQHKYLPEIKSRGKAANSDHYPFSEAGVPAFFYYTLGGPGYYHDIFDTPQTINLKHFSKNFSLLREFLDGF